MTSVQHGLGLLVVPGCVLAIATAVGWGIIGLLPAGRRRVVTPAAPAIGVAAFVVGAHWVALVLPMRRAAWVLLAVGAALVALRAHAGEDRSARHALRTAAAILLPIGCAAVSFLLVMQPLFKELPASAEHPTSNHDAIWYVTNGNWLADHTALSGPHLSASPGRGVDAPSAQPAHDAIDKGFRIGESLVQASITSVDHVPLYRTWLPTTAMWLVLLVGACVALSGVLELPQWVGLAAGIAGASAGLLGFQVLNQNGASVLGMALLPLAVAAVLGARNEAPEPVPLWFAAGALAALAGTYSELLVTVGPALLLVFVAGRTRRVGGKRFIQLAALSLAVSPLAWINAVRALVLTGSANSAFPRHTLRIGSAWAVLSHYAGVIGLDEAHARPVRALVVILIALGGLVASRRVGGLAVFAAAFTGLNGLLVADMVKRRNDYTLERVVMLAQPTILWLATFGLGALTWRLAQRSARPRRALPVIGVAPAAATLTAAALLLVVQAPAVTAAAYKPPILDDRSVQPSLVRAAAEVRRLDPDGRGVMVSDADYVDRLWLGELLRARPAVSWVQLTPDYFSRTTFVAAGRLRWFLVDAAGWQTAAPGKQFGRLRLIDTNRQPFTQVITTGGGWSPAPVFGAQHVAGSGTAEVIRSDTMVPLTWTMSAVATTNLRIRVAGGPVLWQGDAQPEPRDVTISLPTRSVVDLTFEASAPVAVRPEV